MKQQNSYNFEELLACGRGELFGEGNAKLPLPPMLMFDRITSITTVDANVQKVGNGLADLDAAVRAQVALTRPSVSFGRVATSPDGR